mmetsp:Transcript_79761/g.222013  ORF Transcript_79761/g.222013 Transcript_79761/m.222013 type:complete len:110 (+) Transcript_79761:262-591(+)
MVGWGVGATAEKPPAPGPYHGWVVVGNGPERRPPHDVGVSSALRRRMEPPDVVDIVEVRRESVGVCSERITLPLIGRPRSKGTPASGKGMGLLAPEDDVLTCDAIGTPS